MTNSTRLDSTDSEETANSLLVSSLNEMKWMYIRSAIYRRMRKLSDPRNVAEKFTWHLIQNSGGSNWALKPHSWEQVKYALHSFHFTSFIESFMETKIDEPNKLICSQLNGFIAQLVQHAWWFYFSGAQFRSQWANDLHIHSKTMSPLTHWLLRGRLDRFYSV